MEKWYLWIIVGIIFLLIEIITLTFVSFSIAVGCFAAAISSYLSVSFNVQLILFSTSILLNFFTLKSIIYRTFRKGNINVKMNIDGLIGKECRVIIPINNRIDEGRVIVEGNDWRAQTDSNIIIEKDEKVRILKVNSTILIVKRIS